MKKAIIFLLLLIALITCTDPVIPDNNSPHEKNKTPSACPPPPKTKPSPQCKIQLLNKDVVALKKQIEMMKARVSNGVNTKEEQAAEIESLKQQIRKKEKHIQNLEQEKQEFTPSPVTAPPKKILVLVMEGGGARGILGAQFLALLEEKIVEKNGKIIPEFFNFFAGSSIGGIHALFFAMPSKKEKGTKHNSAKNLLELYEQENLKRFFPSLPWYVPRIPNPYGSRHPMYGDSKKKVLEKIFGDTKLIETTKPVAIPTYEYAIHKPLFFFSTQSKDKAMLQIRLSDIGNATSAAPTFFDLAVIEFPSKSGKKNRYFMDGSFLSNNMCMNAYLEVKDTLAPNPRDIVKVLSIGAAIKAKDIPEDKRKDSRTWGAIKWMQNQYGRLIERMLGTPALNSVHNCKKLLKENFMHIPFSNAKFSEIDDISEKNIASLKKTAKDEFYTVEKELLKFLLLEEK